MIVKNVEIHWTAVKQVNQMSGKYQTDFYFTDKAAEAALITKLDDMWETHKGTFKGKAQSMGYTELEDGKIKFKASQAPESNDGQYKFAVGVYDAKAKKLEGAAVPSIGNGTRANVDFEIYPYQFKTNKGLKLNLKNIQILELVEYGNAPAFEVEEGFVAEPDNNFKPEI